MKVIFEVINAIFWLTLVILLTLTMLVVALFYTIVRVLIGVLRININIPDLKYSKLDLRKGI